MQILNSYLRYTDRHLDVFFMLFALILSDFHGNPRRKIELQKKVHRRISVRDINFLAASLFSLSFLLLFTKKVSPENCNGKESTVAEAILVSAQCL